MKKNILEAYRIVFKDPLYLVLAISLTFNLLALYYSIFFQATTFAVFFESNSAFYNWSSIILTLLTSILFGITVSFLVWQRRKRKESDLGNWGNSFISSFLGAISTGCPVCGAVLASFFGISGGLAAFPFQGLEVKLISFGLMAFAAVSSAKSVLSPVCKESFLKFSQGKFVFDLNKKTAKTFIPVAVGLSLLVIVFYLPAIANSLGFHFSFQPNSQANILAGDNKDSNNLSSSDQIIEQINPSSGFVINAVYGDVGPKLLETGAIDFEKMKSLYQKAGQELTDDQIKILTQGSNEKIKITPENSYFLLNFFWALGLANKNQILDEGPMMKYGGQGKIGNFASTGGWSLGAKKATELYSKYNIVQLNSNQQAILEDFAFNSYRPCCSNPTGFPDCNHGMAALALGELMASQGASVGEIFQAFKYVNAFWFPQTYFDMARYFKEKEGKDWPQVDARLIAGKDYSTPQGASRITSWLKANSGVQQVPSGGGGCGV